MNIKKHIPNVLTLANLFCGILAIKVGFSEHYYLAGFFVVFGAIFDFFDGFAARLLKVQNEIGKQLDSLADMVTFGVAPGVVMYSFLKFNFITPTVLSDPWIPDYLSPRDYEAFLPFIAFLIPILSAVRLAKFNIDVKQSDKFIGFPTPANALFFVFIPVIYCDLFYSKTYSITDIINSGFSGQTLIITDLPDLPKIKIIFSRMMYFNFVKYTSLLLVVLLSYLLVSPIEMIALKFKTFGWKGNEIRYIFLSLCLVVILLSLLISSVFVSVPIIILLYIVLSVINNFFKKKENELQS